MEDEMSLTSPCGLLRPLFADPELSARLHAILVSADAASVEITFNRYIHFFEGDIDDTLRQAVGA